MIDPHFDPFAVLQENCENIEALSGQVAHLAQVLQAATRHLQELNQLLLNVQYMTINLNERVKAIEESQE